MSCWNVGACGDFLFQHLLGSEALVWVDLLLLPIRMYLLLASLFLSDGFLL